MTSGSSHRKDVLTLLAIGGAAVLLIAWLIHRSARSTSDPLAAVPVDSFLVVTLDVRAIAESPIGGALFGEKGERTGAMFGVESIEATCGFDPLPHVRAVVMSIPEGETHGDLGFAATGDLAKGALESCAKAIIAKRGGHASTRQSGTFTIVSDDDPRSGALAFRDGGPFLVGKGAWLDAMIDATEGRRPSLATAPASPHRTLRADLRNRDPDASALVASAIVPSELRDRVRREMESTGDAAKLGPSMDGVLAASSVAFAIHAGRAGEDARFTAEVRCDGEAAEAACENVEKMLLHFRLGWSGDLRLRLVGLGPLIDGLETQHGGGALVVRTHAPAADLAKMITRLEALRAGLGGAGGGGAEHGAGGGQGRSTANPPPAPPPDEVMKAPAPSGAPPGRAPP